MLQWQRAAEARAGTDPDESTVMDRDIAIYQTVDADADSDGPGSNRGRTQVSNYFTNIFKLLRLPRSERPLTNGKGAASPHAKYSHAPPFGEAVIL